MTDSGLDDINTYIALTLKEDLMLMETTAAFIELDKMIGAHRERAMAQPAGKQKRKMGWLRFIFL